MVTTGYNKSLLFHSLKFPGHCCPGLSVYKIDVLNNRGSQLFTHRPDLCFLAMLHYQLIRQLRDVLKPRLMVMLSNLPLNTIFEI